MNPRNARGQMVSLYKPEYCQDVIDFLAQGHSINAWCGKIGVTKQTGFVWRDKHPEFGEALEIGLNKAVYWWEQQAIAAASGRNKDAIPSAIIFGLKNRAKDVWRDTYEHTGKDGGELFKVIIGVDQSKV